jgi:hypothetical protein
MDPFRERIENLLRQGKISPEEANKLLRALDNTGDTTSDPITGSKPAPIPPPPPSRPVPPPPPQPVVTPPAAATPPTPPVSGPAPTPPTPPLPNEIQLDETVARLSVSVTAGDVDIRGVPGKRGIHARSNNGTLEVIREADGVRIVAHGRVDDPTEIGWLNTVLKTIGRNLPVNLHVEVPSDLANLEVKALAGDVDVRGVRGRVRMDLQAGDLTLEDASSFEINAKAGDLKVNTTLNDGDSRLTALAGNVDIKLQPGSSVALNASTTAGDVSAKGFVLTQTEKRVTGGSLEGRLGGGRARLTCKLTAGDLDIVAVDGANQ